MGHNINTIAYHGAPPWHGLGVQVKHRPTAGQMIATAALDWQVEMRPIASPRHGEQPKKFQLTESPAPHLSPKFLWAW
jgi:hypothetical protein